MVKQNTMFRLLILISFFNLTSCNKKTAEEIEKERLAFIWDSITEESIRKGTYQPNCFPKSPMADSILAEIEKRRGEMTE